jgi:hypothetical protein
MSLFSPVPPDPATNNIDQFRSIDDIRLRLTDEYHFEQARIEAALTLTQGLSLAKQYELSKLFLNQIQQEQTLNHNNTFINGSFVNEFD